MNVFTKTSMISALRALCLFIGALRSLSFYRCAALSSPLSVPPKGENLATRGGLLPLLRRGLGGGLAFSLLFSAFSLLPFTAHAQFTGTGTAGDPYQIKTAADLAQLATVVNAGDIVYNAAHYRLENNLDLSNYGETFNSGQGWIPIGNVSDKFKGVFNGNSKVITGLYRNGSSGDVGLFGYIEEATIENLGLDNVYISDFNRYGGVVGRANNSSISNCYVTGTIIGVGDGGYRIGGVVGVLNSSSITNCYSTANVSGISYVGGVVGEVTSSGNTLTNCYSTGNVIGTNNWVGGVVGQINKGEIYNCYSTSNVKGNKQVGGVAGSALDTKISNCYSIGAIIGNDFVGGVVGLMSYTPALLSDCAALNPSVKGTGDNVGRVAGRINSIPLSNNIAFDGLLNNDNNTTWNDKELDQKDGADISVETIHADGTLGNRFTAPAWTTQNGKLPGLFGKTVDMPPHLKLAPVAPVITTTTLPAGTVGTAYSQYLIATGTNPITWSIKTGKLPTGLNLAAGGLISGTPTANGTFTFTVKAENAAGDDAKELSITIATATELPVITTTTLPNAAMGSPYNYTLTATGATPITWSLVGGSSIAGINLSSDGLLSGTPTTEGTFKFTVKATNSVGSDSKELSITIGSVGIVETGRAPSLRVYPNPTKGEITIDPEFNSGGKLKVENVEIFDVMGRKAPLNPPEGGRLPSFGGVGGGNIAHLPNGIYFLRITTDSGVVTRKVIKN
ncbi:MAG: T9SS type A sorting domain-containing protein [Bacteroidales bacterium]|nr:T9SS type A sorting domain-containing protein [Bacteroidales bacterium]